VTGEPSGPESVDDATPTPSSRRRHRRVVRRGTEREAVLGAEPEPIEDPEVLVGYDSSDGSGGAERDAALLADRPPHWRP